MMNAPSTTDSWFKRIQKHIRLLSSLAAFLLTLISGILPPIGFSSEERGVLARLAPFIVIVIIGLAFLFGRIWNSQKYKYRWIAITLITFVLAITSFLYHRSLINKYTCSYDYQRVIIGTSLTPRGEKHIKENPGISCETLLNDFTGHVDEIWTNDSMNQIRLFLESIYIVGIVLFATCLMSLGQGIEISTLKDK